MNLTTEVPYNGTSARPTTEISTTIGFVACLISAVGFAINYLPVKRYKTGDGMFFQWIISNAIFIGSFVVSGYLQFPKFEPFVMIGGLLWASGNICVVPIVSSIGLGMGLLIWGSTSIVFGWASGRFGWFGIIPQLPSSYLLNYIGFTLTALSPFLYAMVKVNIVPPILNGENKSENIVELEVSLNDDIPISKISRLRFKTSSKLLALLLSIFSGIMYGFSFIPVTYVKNRYKNSSQRDIDYLFAQCSGIYLASTVYFVVYCVLKGNKPILYPAAILPGFICGFIWLIAYIAYFIAIEALSPAITQPIVTPVSGIVSTLITVIIFREVKGIRNYMIIIVAIIIASTGATLIGISKII